MWYCDSVDDKNKRTNKGQFAKAFYMSGAWIECARAYRKSVGGLCERCAAKGLIVPAEEVHHKVKLAPDNLSDPTIALDWNNLEALCKDCHIKAHRKKRWRVDEQGKVDL